MSTLRFSTAALAIAAFSGATAVHAQTPTDQSVIQQTKSQQAQPVEQRQKQDRPATSRSQDAGQKQRQQQGPTVKEALVQKLIKANEGEIELAKMAQQKSNNDELKQLAKTIVQDHQSLNQTLQQHAGSSGSDQSNSGTTRSQGNGNRAEQAGSTGMGKRNTVPKQLCKIAEQACDNALKMTKDMLGNYEGQDFNMAFLGQQCVAHTMMLAELKAIESNGPKELRPIASEAAGKVEKHLDNAKRLAKKLEDDRRNRS